MVRALVVGICSVAAGCVTVQTTSNETLSSEGVFFVEGRTDAGDLAYDGVAIREEFSIGVRTRGHGSSKRKATARKDDNDAIIEVDGDLLSVAGFAGRRSGVDFDIVGPGFMNVDFVTLGGSGSLANVEGSHIVTADTIFATNVIGDVDLYANNGGLDVEVIPYLDGIVFIDSVNGPADIYLPYGLDYDLNVLADPEFVLEIDDLGFDTLVLEPGLAIGWRGSRRVQVNITVTGGDTRILGTF